MSCSVTFIPGLQPGVRRGLAFLDRAGDSHINAKAVFQDLGDKTRFELLSRFQHWQDGNIFPGYHHGWSAAPNDKCYVFKWRRGTVRYRMYGFLIHPRATDKRFEACILVSYTQKSEHETDPIHLVALNKLRNQPDVIQAVNYRFAQAELTKAGAGR